MKVVYHCFGGAHASPTAAAIHLGIIDRTKPLKWHDFQKIPYFDITTNLEHGRLIKVGDDYLGNTVYIMGRRNAAKVAINLLREFTRLTGGNPEDYYFVDCVQLYNPFMVTGGFTSRSLGLVSFGRPVVTFGTRLAFPVLVTIVNKTLAYLEQRSAL